jgi:hypothetical protein
MVNRYLLEGLMVLKDRLLLISNRRYEDAPLVYHDGMGTTIGEKGNYIP